MGTCEMRKHISYNVLHEKDKYCSNLFYRFAKDLEGSKQISDSNIFIERSVLRKIHKIIIIISYYWPNKSVLLFNMLT